MLTFLEAWFHSVTSTVFNTVEKSISDLIMFLNEVLKNYFKKIPLPEFAQLVSRIILQLRQLLLSRVSWVVVAHIQLYQMKRVEL